MSTALLQANNLHWSINGRDIVNDVSISVAPGTMLGIVGPNGSGKTSLLRMLAGLNSPSSGEVQISGSALSSLRRKEIARRLAYVEQIAHTEMDLNVRDVVGLGRLPHHRSWRSLPAVCAADAPIIDEVAAHTGISELLDRSWTQLSGGERQHAQIARALAQDAPVILLDEPTNHLDISHQLDILRLVQESEAAAVVVLHDLNLASMFCDHIHVMRDGRTVAEGAPDSVLNQDLIADVFSVSPVISETESGRPAIRYLL
ncbi:MAG: ABC transporter ATP-binding protein [Corynebacterium flavescens]|uniref:ABC transporter ATP-binding protein n=1 Tax=Corynebacterium flavescens TaxID=28028 RepID=UPI0026483A45|nr:ABC transporter ATP-binding protein [Corynebacterium flavescens]MDN6552784.1 ABC transporter ATP-binding protein [Corynebacterium flavescens]